MHLRSWLTDEQRWVCLLVAAVNGLLIAYVARQIYGSSPMGARDFENVIGGARALLHGLNPWHDPAFGPGKSYPFNEPLYYPLPTLVVVLPLAWLSGATAGALFIGGSSGLLAYAVLRTHPTRLLLFLSPSFIVAVGCGQWSPLALAALLLPSLSALGWLKPSYGLMTFLAHPRFKGPLLLGALGLAGLLVLPAWLSDWRQAAGDGTHGLPLLIVGAPLLLLAALRWRRPEARLLLGLALVPHLVFWYDGLLTWYVVRSWKQSLLLFVAGWAAFLPWYRLSGGIRGVDELARPLVVLGVYLPALAILLWQERAALAAMMRRLPFAAAGGV